MVIETLFLFGKYQYIFQVNPEKNWFWLIKWGIGVRCVIWLHLAPKSSNIHRYKLVFKADSYAGWRGSANWEEYSICHSHSCQSTAQPPTLVHDKFCHARFVFCTAQLQFEQNNLLLDYLTRFVFNICCLYIFRTWPCFNFNGMNIFYVGKIPIKSTRYMDLKSHWSMIKLLGKLYDLKVQDLDIGSPFWKLPI